MNKKAENNTIYPLLKAIFPLLETWLDNLFQTMITYARIRERSSEHFVVYIVLYTEGHALS